MEKKNNQTSNRTNRTSLLVTSNGFRVTVNIDGSVSEQKRNDILIELHSALRRKLEIVGPSWLLYPDTYRNYKFAH